jgi:transcriptional regulator
MPSRSIDLPQGTLDLLILRTLSLEPLHGWAVSERIQQISCDMLRVQQGSLYPALHRLERRGWIKARWGTSDNAERSSTSSPKPDGASSRLNEPPGRS